MAVVAFWKRGLQYGTNTGVSLIKLRGFSSSTVDRVPIDDSLIRLFASPHLNSRINKFDCRQISQLVQSNGRRAFLVDTLALVRKLEAQGVPTKQAEAITAAITEVLNDSLENVAQSFVSKGEMQKSEMIQESSLSKFKSEVQSSQDTG